VSYGCWKLDRWAELGILGRLHLRHKFGCWCNFAMNSQKTLYTKNVANELRFPLVSHTTCFDTWFGHYGFLKSGYGAGQILDRLDIQVNDQVFGPLEERNLLGFEHEFWSQHGQLSNAYLYTHFQQPQQRLRPFEQSRHAEFSGSLKLSLANGFGVLPWV
jgi:hypothetical protein